MKKTIHSTYKHYRRNADGTETYLGEVAYSYVADVTPPSRTRVRTMTEAMLEASNLRQAAIRDSFERLVDAAQEGAD